MPKIKLESGYNDLCFVQEYNSNFLSKNKQLLKRNARKIIDVSKHYTGLIGVNVKSMGGAVTTTTPFKYNFIDPVPDCCIYKMERELLENR